MRSAYAIAVAASVAIVAWIVESLASGLIAGAAWLVAMFAAVMTLALAIAAAVDRHGEQLHGPGVGRRHTRLTLGWPSPGRTVVCGSCHHAMTPVTPVWMCRRCDGVDTPAGHRDARHTV